ncbi:ATP-binding protein [Reyranella sp. CPCC 100927]|uniref:ATP-binding protein n=1 Tax=Reyranella sp. CPCC 100927 TaxID=2599616 RepID=UPI0011B726D2|nr:ATP-binding protein [Reyranella sp. CPCC 100927]TWT09630.1 ATP-binding protein [Reyranella sp. CPCC 100927]
MVALGELLAGKLTNLLIDSVSKGLLKRVKDRKACAELGAICASAIEHAARRAPPLAEGLRSASFLDGIILPVMRSALEDPSQLIQPEDLANRYIDMFVLRFAKDGNVDGTLLRVFQTDRSTLILAFEAFFVSLKSELYCSKHWREVVHHQTTEALFADVSRVREILEGERADARITVIDLNRAQIDAAKASADLQNWPKDILGVTLERPLLQSLLNHIEKTPAGTSLLIGEAGSGKSALLAEMIERLVERGIIPFAIKADMIPATVTALDEVGCALGMVGDLEDQIAALAMHRPVALLIDQLDAVSNVMDRRSERMRLLLRLVRNLRERSSGGGIALRVHALISSRPFEAAHDARFRRLGAQEFRLDLFSAEQVVELLGVLGIDQSGIDPGLRQTLRRPFALKLYADLVKRGVDVSSLGSAYLLERWLDTVDLGAPDERRDCVAFMVQLASEMIETESLWRPSDRFELEFRDAIRCCEACGLIRRNGNTIGFSHQTWLDDFQAKAFRIGTDLAEYVWQNQDSLFIRATVARGLQRLRAYDQQSFVRALHALFRAKRTRRHIHHLIVDLIATNPTPLSAEGGWVETWVRTDFPLASRALRQIAQRWEGWRGALRDALPAVMMQHDLRWQAVQLLAAEACVDSDHVWGLVNLHWDAEQFDLIVFQLLDLTGLIGRGAADRLDTIFGRTTVDQHNVSRLVSRLRSGGRYEEAIKVVQLWLSRQAINRDHHPKLYELEKLADAAPFGLARTLVPWFLKLATAEVEDPHRVRDEFPRSRSLPWDWDHPHELGSVFGAFLSALEKSVVDHAEEAWFLLEPLCEVEVDEIQQVIAATLIAAGPKLAPKSVRFLLDDPRRFNIGSVHVDDENNVGHLIQGWHSHELVGVIAPELDRNVLCELRDSIERWVQYGPEAFEADAELKRCRLQWAEEARLPLLERLPRHVLSARRHRQISEWRAKQPKIKGPPNARRMASLVGSPMTAAEMERAHDDAIVGMLNKIDDQTSDRRFHRPASRGGGVRQLADAFGAFGKVHPARACRIARERMIVGKHERAAGDLVRELAGVNTIDPSEVLTLILDLCGRGFSSESWRQDAAHALEALADRLRGLNDEVIEVLESWLEGDADKIAQQVSSRRDFEAKNRNSRSEKLESSSNPIMFGRRDRLDILPHHNFTILSAIAAGLLSRNESDCDGWLTALERHAKRHEDPEIWAATFIWRGRALAWTDKARFGALIRHLWIKDPLIFTDLRLAHFLWRMRAAVPKEVLGGILAKWFSCSDDDGRAVQAAAEFVYAGHIVEPENALYSVLWTGIDRSIDAVELGLLFSAAAAWRENAPTLRLPAHATLMEAARADKGAHARAISTAFSWSSKLPADEQTAELIQAAAASTHFLRAALSDRFIDSLQGLLLYPGFDEVVLSVAEKAVALVTKAERHSGMWMVGQDLVHVTVALQRSGGPLRARAMDLYEDLLDAEVYGAEEAARGSLSR